jgi:dethiobiotin synthetase
MNIFVTAIGTDSGKTIASAIITAALQADYWKPVQCGMDETDSSIIKTLVSNPLTKIHPEKYLLKTAASPHLAAEIEGIKIQLEDFILPATSNDLILEGAGGILVPLNYDGDFVIDLAAKFEAEVIVVANLYLGSINHTLLTINELKRRNLNIKGIIFNGEPNETSEKVILSLTNLTCLLHIKKEAFFTKELVSEYAKKIIL